MDRLQRFAATALSLVLVIALTFASTSALQRSALDQASVVGTPVSLGEIVVEAEREVIEPEQVLWLARVIYSETKRPHEQELVAWVVRNRVETSYRGGESYREVALDPYQFSAFNPGSSKRSYYSSLNRQSKAPGFQRALSIAERVAMAPPSERPFSEMTRHFFSRRSMVGGSTPNWAVNQKPVQLANVEPERFRFYANVF